MCVRRNLRPGWCPAPGPFRPPEPRRARPAGGGQSRLRYDAALAEVELVSDRSEGPHPGVRRFSAREYLARLVDHAPERYEVRVRYSGTYATRQRVWWRRRGVVLAGTSSVAGGLGTLCGSVQAPGIPNDLA